MRQSTVILSLGVSWLLLTGCQDSRSSDPRSHDPGGAYNAAKSGRDTTGAMPSATLGRSEERPKDVAPTQESAPDDDANMTDTQEVHVPAAVAAAAQRHGTIVSVGRPVRSSNDFYSFTYDLVVDGADGQRELTIREDGAILRNDPSGTINP